MMGDGTTATAGTTDGAERTWEGVWDTHGRVAAILAALCALGVATGGVAVLLRDGERSLPGWACVIAAIILMGVAHHAAPSRRSVQIARTLGVARVWFADSLPDPGPRDTRVVTWDGADGEPHLGVLTTDGTRWRLRDVPPARWECLV